MESIEEEYWKKQHEELIYRCEMMVIGSRLVEVKIEGRE